MESQKHVVVSSQLIYKVEFFEIFISICKSLLNNKVFFCFTRRNSKTRACMLEDGLEKPASDFNFYVPSMLPASYSKNYRLHDMTLFNIRTTTTEIQKPTADQYFSKITERLLVAYENREYYIGIKQSNLYGSYQIYLSRHMLTADQYKISEFCLTIPAARALMGYLPQIVHRQPTLKFYIWSLELLRSLRLFHSKARQLIWYDVFYFVLRQPSKWPMTYF